MKPSEKAKRRLENKKRKVSAFLQVAELNDSEKRRKILNDDGNNSDLEDTKEKPPKKPLLSGESYEELRLKLRERKKILMQIPDLEMKTVGHEADIDMHENFRVPLFMKDLQHLLLYALMGAKAPIEPCRWCKFTKWSRLNGIVCLVIEGVGLKDFHEHRETEFSEIAKFLKFKLEFLSPSSYDSKVAMDFSLIPVSQRQKEKLKQKYGGVERAIEQGSAYRVLRSMFPMRKTVEDKDSKEKSFEDDKSLKLKLLLSINQMIDEGYPVPLEGAMKEKYRHFVMTKSEYTEVTEDSPLFSVDCEMCLTTAGMELTRICVVNSKLETVYTTLVKPKNPIKNYLTRFSGISKDLLEDVTTTLDEVQKKIIEILPPDAILIGQSLHSDLCAMQMMHPYVIDTSVIYCITGCRTRKSKLSVLSKIFLGQEIQQEKGGSHVGHDPKEDADAAMKLVLLKLENGYTFGDVLLDGTVPDRSKESENPSDEILSSTLFNHAKDNNQTVCIVGQTQTLEQYQKYSQGAVVEEIKNEKGEVDALRRGVVYADSSSDKESIKKSCELSFSHNLTICHTDLSSLIESENGESHKRKSVKYVKKWTEKMWSHTSLNGLFVTVWPGDKNQNAFVGIALNKAKPVFD